MIDQFVLFTFFSEINITRQYVLPFPFRNIASVSIRNVFSIHIMSVHESKLFCNYLERSFFWWYRWEKTCTRIVSLLRKAFSIQVILKSWVWSSWRTRPSLSTLSFMMRTICLTPLTFFARLRLSLETLVPHKRRKTLESTSPTTLHCTFSGFVFADRRFSSHMALTFVSYSLVGFHSQGVQKYISFSLFFSSSSNPIVCCALTCLSYHFRSERLVLPCDSRESRSHGWIAYWELVKYDIDLSWSSNFICRFFFLFWFLVLATIIVRKSFRHPEDDTRDGSRPRQNTSEIFCQRPRPKLCPRTSSRFQFQLHFILNRGSCRASLTSYDVLSDWMQDKSVRFITLNKSSVQVSYDWRKNAVHILDHLVHFVQSFPSSASKNWTSKLHQYLVANTLDQCRASSIPNSYILNHPCPEITRTIPTSQTYSSLSVVSS